MKKLTFAVAGMMTMMLAGCGTMGTTGSSSASNVLGSILSAATNGKTITNAIASVIGLDKMTQESLVGTWKYSEPGAAFTSENLLAKAGGEVAATKIREQLADPYKKAGITSSNTQFVFNSDGTFKATLAGKTINGTYSYNASTSALTLKPSSILLQALGSINGYATRSGLSGVAILFESKKILNILQTVSALSGNTTLSTIGDLSTNYDGVRIGFDMTR